VAASCDSLGVVLLYALRPALFKNHCICKLQNLQSTGRPCGVFSLAFVADTCSLYTGDESGDVKVWTLSRLFEAAMVFPGKRYRGSRPASSGDGAPPASATLLLSPSPATSARPQQLHPMGSSLMPTPSGSSRAQSVMTPNPEDSASVVELRKQWSAHNEAVQRIDVIPSHPIALLTYSSDRRVRAYYGTLR
jgi:hypothetical protein